MTARVKGVLLLLGLEVPWESISRVVATTMTWRSAGPLGFAVGVALRFAVYQRR